MFDFSDAADRLALSQTALIGSLALACVWETIAPARPSSRQALWRWFNNLLLAVLNHAVLLLAIPVAYASLVSALDWQHVGLLQRANVHPAVAVIVLMLAIEAVGYFMHRIYHEVPLLWRLHAVHHSDTELDFSTAYRHHVLEVLLTALATLPVLMVLGPDVSVLVAYQLLSALVVALSHANISFGPVLNRVLAWVIVTPDFHRVHHSSDVRFTNSHYCTVTPIFDHLLGTAHAPQEVPQPEAEMGLEYFREPRYLRLDRLLLLPFTWKA